jgi:HEAT repeat protein
MDEVAKLIRKAKGSSTGAEDAASRLAAAGAEAAPSIIRAMRKDPEGNTFYLRRALLQMHDPELVPLMVELLDEEETYLRSTAFEVLGLSRDERGFEPLLGQLEDEANLASARLWAAKALGELGNAGAAAALLSLVEEVGESRPPKHLAGLLIEAVVALAKLGRQEKAPAVIALAEHRDQSIRVGAVKALKYLVGPGLFPALQKALRARNDEIRQDAIEAVAYLGARESIEELGKRAADSNPDFATEKIARLRDLTGEEFDFYARPEQIRRALSGLRKEFEPGVCYRLGRPIRLPDVMAQLKTPFRLRKIVEELRVITGQDFARGRQVKGGEQPLLFEEAQEWWRREGDKFKPGRLYKYGWEQSLENVF